MGVETRHMIYHCKFFTLPYINSRHGFPFKPYLITQTDMEVTTMDFIHLGGMQFVPFVDWSYELEIKNMIFSWKDYDIPYMIK
jgi:hypothetical protein